MFLGASSLSNFRLGASQVDKIYLGAEEVWSSYEEDLLFFARSADDIVYRKGEWITGATGLQTATTILNPDFFSSDYGYMITATRIATNSAQYNQLAGFSYGSSVSDNYGHFVQQAHTGYNNLFFEHRLNNYSSVGNITFNVGQTRKMVGQCGPSTGSHWYSSSSRFIRNQTRDLARDLNFRVGFNLTNQITITNVALFKRAITNAEKNAYFDNTFPLFL
jgi:hypothetical protein